MTMSDSTDQGLYLLDYGAGNVRSVFNAVEALGYKIKMITSEADFDAAKKIIFPGVGAFEYAMKSMSDKNFTKPLLKYIDSGRPLMGICVGMQILFEGSEESKVPGLGIFPGKCEKFNSKTKSVPKIGWDKAVVVHTKNESETLGISDSNMYYFVHSYAVPYTASTECAKFVHTATRYGDQVYISSVWNKNIFATQFHPEKSGKCGLDLLKHFICNFKSRTDQSETVNILSPEDIGSYSSVRVIACMDVRANDQGDLVVTKGDQYDVRESNDTNQVRNLGKPVELAARYYKENADEVAFLNITSFRDIPLNDTPMLQVLREASKSVFIPMTVGGGIRGIKCEKTGQYWSPVEVADAYFQAGADKVSIGSDSVYSAENYWKSGCKLNGDSSIEQISKAYGSQAVVVSIDPKRVYVESETQTTHHTIPTSVPGPNGEKYCWYQCTVMGGRETRDFDVVQLATAVQALGAGEILLNCIDKDGTNSGYDLELIKLVKKNVTIPVIASSGAGRVEHFSEAVLESGADAVLAAGIFHRNEIPISDVKTHMENKGIIIRK
ncbi:hypothetical protein BB558_006859 [Smittium angustum]|uniref:Imidazole glycerol phosphate synthase hisHF n=1 Tax=Smittium angustum TaxID=133377 RepID=A0A2U1IWK2_SMIAN|nr:hypothetical protein BB558_006859 [Smittium angustum]